MSRGFPFALVDAFSRQPLAGNPCAVVLSADGLEAKEMLAIAKEMNQSETAFIMQSDTCDLRARYFTPEREIPLAGHPTIASIHIALEMELISAQKDKITLELNDGPIQVHLEKSPEGTLIKMFQRKPQFLEIHNSGEVLPLFGLSPEDILSDAPIQTVSTGTRQLMIAVKSPQVLKKVKMDGEAYKNYREKMNFFSPHLFCVGGATSKGDTFAIHPGVAPDTLEDAFTGSATGAMAAYLFKYGLIQKSKFVAEQGHWMGRPGEAIVEVFGTPEDIESVAVAGRAVTTVRGTLII